MNTTPRGNRLHIGIFGRVNCGKSTLLNLITGQETALASAVAGTTTDLVEKAMELLPIGPVLLLDTPGTDDVSTLAAPRLERTARALEKSDVAVLVVESGVWGASEDALAARLRKRGTPLVIVVNKCDQAPPTEAFIERLRTMAPDVLLATASDASIRETFLVQLKAVLARIAPADRKQPPLVADLVPPNGLVLLVVPIDASAPKGRLILPQVQTIREVLDHDSTVIVVKETQLAQTLCMLQRKPDLVVADSQAILEVVEILPPDVPCTTFSILFARAKGDLVEAAKGAAGIAHLKAGAAVLIAEGCTHHALEDDIGRVKIPRLLRKLAGVELEIDCVSGCAFPPALRDFDLVIHCGACTMNRGEMLGRIAAARAAGVPITNYGMTIAFVQGVLRRVLEPFPDAYGAFVNAAEPGREVIAC